MRRLPAEFRLEYLVSGIRRIECLHSFIKSQITCVRWPGVKTA